MQTNLDTYQKAQKYLKRYKTWCVIWAIVVVATCVVIANVIPRTWTGWLLLLPLWVICWLGSVVIFRKCVTNILYTKLDADTYLGVIYMGKVDTPAALWQVLGEYFCGRYANVVGICKQKLADPKMAKKFSYHYWSYLANVYFDTGDDQALGEVMAQYKARMAGETPARQAKLGKTFVRMALYEAYLAQDMEACYAWLQTPTPFKINQYQRTFCKARLALCKGEVAEARGYLESLVAEVPNLNYGRLATKMLETMDGGNTAEIVLEPVTEAGNVFYAQQTPRQRKTRKILLIVLASLAIFSMAINFAEDAVNDYIYQQEIKAYKEDLCELLETGYGGVSVLDVFNLEKEDAYVDSMFIAKTESHLLVGCTYLYEGEEQVYYKVFYEVEIQHMLSRGNEYKFYGAFDSVTSSHHVHSYWYGNPEDVPAVYVYLSEIQVDGETFYFVVEEIEAFQDFVAT